MSYTKQNFVSKQRLSAAELNYIEDGISAVAEDVAQINEAFNEIVPLIDKQKAQVYLGVNTTDVEISIQGNGTVTINYGDGTSETVDLNGTHVFKYRYRGAQAIHNIKIHGLEHLTSFDAHGCNIDNISFGKLDLLNKLVIYDNNITDLDISGLANLQYLHIFNNPICESDDALAALFAQLPNRNNKAFGSIIMYPFYPLGVLVYKASNTLTKYPSNTSIAPVEGQLYRDMNATEVKWYKYENSVFVEQLEQNALINRRIAMEAITLPLGWLFGSAIQYDDAEYSKCEVYFKQNHIQDYWETAERGLGLTFGMFDNIAGQGYGFADWNVKAYLAPGGTSASPRTVNSSNNAYVHGDRILSCIASRGELSYGVSPDCQLYLIDDKANNKTHKSDYLNGVELLTSNADIISNSTFFGTTYPGIEDGQGRAKFNSFAINHPLFTCTSNNGDGKAWTKDEISASIENRFGPNTFLVSSINGDDTVSAYSASCPNGENYTGVDLFAQYGDGFSGYCPYFQTTVALSGTSYSTPICASIVLLMMNIYNKLHGETSTAYGKNTDFMNFVKIHTNPLYNSMNRATGNGRPDLMCYNSTIAENRTVTVESLDITDISILHGQSVVINPTILPLNSDNYAVTYDYDMSQVAITEDRIYPLLNNTDEIQIKAYSNMNADCASEFTITVTESSLPIYEINDKSLSLNSVQDSQVQDFTVQMVVDFPDVDVEETKTLLTFLQGDNYNSPLEIIYSDTVSKQIFQFITNAVKPDGTSYLYSRHFLSYGQQVEDLEGSSYVVTICTFNNYLKLYLNGNLISECALRVPLKLSELSIPEEYSADVRIYNRALSIDEIIQNTIALLNGNGKDPQSTSAIVTAISEMESLLDEIVALQENLKLDVAEGVKF